MVKFTENNMKTLEKRYLLKDNTGKTIETPDQLFDRVVNTICGNNNENDTLKSNILEMMHDLRFLPNTPTLMNAGTQKTLSACFVINIDDTLESIVHDAGWQQALIHKMGGGVGMNFSKLRPKGDLIKGTGGVTTGVMGFLPIFNELSESIRQGGKRDGANMGILSISHPEIENWITAKVNNNRFRNFNLSVLVTDEFMKAVEQNLDWSLHFNDKVYKIVKAQYLFNLICDSAHKCGCPGVIFVDEINRDNPLKEIMWIDTTNPCGEIPAFAGYYDNKLVAESCNLGSLNLSKYMYYKDTEHRRQIFDFDKYKNDIHNAVEFLDLVIDVNNYPFPFIEKGTKLTRKIGLGVAGLSECLIKLKMEYGSKESIEFIETIMKILQDESHKKSEELGHIKGNFPLNYLVSPKYENRRNLFTTCIAPTGTIGRFMLGHPYSSGVEPPPAICMSSNIIDSKIEDGIHPLLITTLKERMKYNPEFENFDIDKTLKQIKENGKSIQHLTQIPEDIRKLFKVAEEIPIEDHINVQSTIQKYIDNAVSKTINMNNNATIDDVKKAYLLAHKTHCKGVTIYRDNCKDHQVFESSKKETQQYPQSQIKQVTHIDDLAPRDNMLPGITFTKRTGCSTLFITPTKMWNEDGALELFLNKSNEKGGCLGLQDGLAIAISVYNRYLESIDHQHAVNALSLVTEHLLRKTCRASELAIEKQKQKIENGEKVNRKIDSLSCPNAIAQCLKYMLEHDINISIDGKQQYITDTKTQITTSIHENKNKCPECGNTMLFKQDGCMNYTCICGWGGCS